MESKKQYVMTYKELVIFGVAFIMVGLLFGMDMPGWLLTSLSSTTSKVKLDDTGSSDLLGEVAVSDGRNVLGVQSNPAIEFDEIVEGTVAVYIVLATSYDMVGYDLLITDVYGDNVEVECFPGFECLVSEYNVDDNSVRLSGVKNPIDESLYSGRVLLGIIDATNLKYTDAQLGVDSMVSGLDEESDVLSYKVGDNTLGLVIE